jgi:large subunit ribosomal protein L6
MSKTGQKPIPVPAGVTVTVSGDKLSVKGPKGELTQKLPATVKAVVEGANVRVSRTADLPQNKADHGTVRSIVANMVEGVVKGYTRELEIEGVGFKAAIQGQKLEISLGFPSPVTYMVPDGVKVTVEAGTRMVVTGTDKQKVGDAAARIRAFFPAEPYKGKGLRYKGERIRRKVGKTVA